MKLNTLFYLILICFLFTSCGEAYVNMGNTIFQIEKENYTINEDIKINLSSCFLPEECVMGGSFYITVYNKAKEENCIFNLKKINEKEINPDNEVYLHYLNFGQKEYRYVIKSNKQITSFNTDLTISMLETGEYLLSLHFHVVSPKHKLGGCLIKQLPFTVTE